MSETAARAAMPPQARTMHDQVVVELRSILMNGELAEGKRVPETALCERLGISRTPLREALKVLAAEGFIELRANRGGVVVPLDGGALASIFELKGPIERLIGHLVAERIEPEELAQLERLHRDLRECCVRSDTAAYTRLNHDFHASLAAATRNETIVQVYSGLQQKILRARFAINERPVQLSRSMAEHEGIMAMLRARAGLDLGQRLEEHSRRTGEAMVQELRARNGAPR